MTERTKLKTSAPKHSLAPLLSSTVSRQFADSLTAAWRPVTAQFESVAEEFRRPLLQLERQFASVRDAFPRAPMLRMTSELGKIRWSLPKPPAVEIPSDVLRGLERVLDAAERSDRVRIKTPSPPG